MTTLRTLIAGASAVSALALATSAFAADPVNNATADVTANFISALNVANTHGMDFGTATRPGTGGAVLHVTTGGTVSAVSGTTVTNASGAAAAFTLSAGQNDSFNITTTYDAGSSTGYSVDGFIYGGTCGASTGGAVTLGSTATSCNLTVGGDLHAPAGATGGNVGTIKVEINYGA